MTTTITVKTHDWAVEVTRIADDGSEHKQVVPPHGEDFFHIWQGSDLRFTELKLVPAE